MSVPVDDGSDFRLGEQDAARFAAILARYPTRRSALMPTLWLIQDRDGHISDAAVSWTATQLELSEAKVREVVSFYVMYRDRPQARHVLQVCHNISCHIMGAQPLMIHLEGKLGIRRGETTPDGEFALEGVECLGACGMGPCLQLGTHLYENVTPAKADALLESLRRGVVPRADTDREGVD